MTELVSLPSLLAVKAFLRLIGKIMVLQCLRVQELFQVSLKQIKVLYRIRSRWSRVEIPRPDDVL